jgi:hypothetical protein
MNEDFSKYLDQQYQIGYDEGELGSDYTGRTFIGYYGWLEGHEAYLLRRRVAKNYVQALADDAAGSSGPSQDLEATET